MILKAHSLWFGLSPDAISPLRLTVSKHRLFEQTNIDLFITKKEPHQSLNYRTVSMKPKYPSDFFYYQ